MLGCGCGIAPDAEDLVHLVGFFCSSLLHSVHDQPLGKKIYLLPALGNAQLKVIASSRTRMTSPAALSKAKLRGAAT